jgi:predicted dehydrogenase
MVAKIRWGVLSTAAIGTKKVIPGMQASQRGTVEAIASRDASRARQAAADLGIAKSYGSYEELLCRSEYRRDLQSAAQQSACRLDFKGG